MNKILIIKTSALGDVVRTTSFLRGLKSKYDPCSIYWVTGKNAVELLKGNPLIDTIFNINEADDVASVMNMDLDLAINLEEKLSACKLASACGKSGRYGAYFNRTRNAIEYTENSNDWFDMSLISRHGKKRADELKQKNTRTYQDIVSSSLNIENNRPMIFKNDKVKNAFMKRYGINEEDNVIGINTGAGKRWMVRRWSSERIVELIDLLNHELDVKVVLYGGPEETDRNKKILKLARSEVFDAGCNNTLSEFVGLVDVCNVLITSDTLAMHIAVALQKYVIAMFGPTSSTEIDLYNKGSKIVPDLPCISCYSGDCDKPVKCMELITVEDVFERVNECLSDPHKIGRKIGELSIN